MGDLAPGSAAKADTVRRTLNGARQIIETVNDQPKEQFHVEVNHVGALPGPFPGLAARLHTKLAARVPTGRLCLYLNRLLGKDDILQIKALAFPN